MPSLHLILLFEHPPHRQSWYLEGLARWLQAWHQELAITAVYNGQPYDLDAQLAGLTSNYVSHTLPLRLAPERILAQLLEQPLPAADARLWLSAESLLPFTRVDEWLAELRQTPLISPSPLPQGVAGRRHFQAQAPVAKGPFALAPANLLRLPACLLWRGDQDRVLQDALTSSRLDLAVSLDTGARVWAAPEPAVTDPELSWPEAEAAWQQLRQAPDAQQLKALLGRSPASVRLYPLAARCLPREAALELLAQAFGRDLLSPMLLKTAADLLRPVEPAAAADCETLFERRFGQSGTSRPIAYAGWADCLPRRERLSVCLIVRNEAEQILDCLQSVAGLADEMIVVDTGSTDATVALAETTGARVFEHTWPDDFSAARNLSLAYADSDWILVLDADQQLEPASRVLLEQWLWDPSPGLPRAQVRIANLSRQGHVSLVHYEARLFPRSAGLRYRGRVHEEVVFRGVGVSPSPVLDGISLLHWGYISEVIVSKDKARRNTELLLKQYADEPNQVHWMSYLGDSVSAMGEHEAALGWYRQVLAAWDQPEPERPVLVITLLRTLNQFMTLLLKLRRPAELLQLAERYESVCEQVPDFWYTRGLACLLLESEDQAAACFERCLALGRNPDLLNGLTFSYTPDYLTRLPLQQLLLLDSGNFRRGLKSLLPERLGQWFVSGCLPAADFPHPLLYWAEACIKGNAELPSVPDDIASSPPGQGILLALSWWRPEQNLPVSWWPTGLETGLVWSGLDRATRLGLCQQLWASQDPGNLWLAMALLYLNLIKEQDVDAMLLLSMLLYQAGQKTLALRLVQSARQVLPRHPKLLNNEAILLFETGQAESACQRLRDCLQLNPDFDEARENLEGIQAWLQAQSI